MITNAELTALGFTHAATYQNNTLAMKPTYIRKAGSKVYLLLKQVTQDEYHFCYVGQTRRRDRPFQYLENSVMLRVRDGIIEENRRGNPIHLFISDSFIHLTSTVNGLPVNLHRNALEGLLIDHHLPFWNSVKFKSGDTFNLFGLEIKYQEAAATITFIVRNPGRAIFNFAYSISELRFRIENDLFAPDVISFVNITRIQVPECFLNFCTSKGIVVEFTTSETPILSNYSDDDDGDLENLATPLPRGPNLPPPLNAQAELPQDDDDRPWQLAKRIVKCHNEQFDQNNLPMPARGRGPTIQMNGDRIACGRHAFASVETTAQWVYWIGRSAIRIGVFISNWQHTDLDILTERARALQEASFGGDIHRTIVLHVQGGTNNVGEYDRIATECVTRMKEIWRVLQGIQ